MGNNDYTCIHEEQIQAHSRKIENLTARADFKDRRIDELKDNYLDMNKKLDMIVNTVNEIRLQSKSDDNELEVRLQAIETELELQKLANSNTRSRVNIAIAIFGILLTIITIVLNVLLG